MKKNITIDHPEDKSAKLFVVASLSDRVEVHSMSLRKGSMILKRDTKHLGEEYLARHGFDPREVSFEIEEALLEAEE